MKTETRVTDAACDLGPWLGWVRPPIRDAHCICWQRTLGHGAYLRKTNLKTLKTEALLQSQFVNCHFRESVHLQGCSVSPYVPLCSPGHHGGDDRHLQTFFSCSVRVLLVLGLGWFSQAAQMLVDTVLKLISRNWAWLGLLHLPLLRGPDRKATSWA